MAKAKSELRHKDDDVAAAGHHTFPSPEDLRAMELKSQLKERTADAEFRRWKERHVIWVITIAALIVCAVWAAVKLMPGFPPEVRQQTDSLITHLFTGLLGGTAGVWIKKAIERGPP